MYGLQSGDQCTGRFASGLSLHGTDSAILPQHFVMSHKYYFLMQSRKRFLLITEDCQTDSK